MKLNRTVKQNSLYFFSRAGLHVSTTKIMYDLVSPFHTYAHTLIAHAHKVSFLKTCMKMKRPKAVWLRINHNYNITGAHIPICAWSLESVCACAVNFQ